MIYYFIICQLYVTAVIEAQKDSSVVYERVVTTVDFGVLHLFVAPSDDIIYNSSIDIDEIDRYNSDNYNIQTSFITFLKTLGLTNEAGTSVVKDTNNGNSIDTMMIDKIGIEENIKCIEIVVNKELFKVHFSVPSLCREISTDSIKSIIDSILSIGHSSQENKLVIFVKQSRKLYKEIIHQQLLKSYGLSDIWGFKYYITWIMFANAVLMNVLILLYVGTTTTDNVNMYSLSRHLSSKGSGGVSTASGTTIYAQPDASFIILVLIGFQIAFSFITLFIYFTVKVPVTLSLNLEKHGLLMATIQSVIDDPLPLWYLSYFCITILSMTVSELFLSLISYFFYFIC